MKTADIIANLKNSYYGDIWFNKKKEEKNVKAIFDILDKGFYWDKNFGEYSLNAETIIKQVAKFSKNEVAKSIAKKFSEPILKYPMTKKQAWVLAFEFIKI